MRERTRHSGLLLSRFLFASPGGPLCQTRRVTPALARLGLIASLVALPASAFGVEDESVRQAREEVEREMQKLVQVPDGNVQLVWTGFDHKGFDVDEAHFELDGQALPAGALDALAQTTDHTLFQGKLEDGTHHLRISLLLHRSNISVLGGYRITQFRVNSDVPFPAAKALSVPVRVGMHVDPDADDPNKKLVLKTDVKPKMLVAVDDSIPPPIVPPPVQVVAATAPPVVEAPTAAAEPPAAPEPEPAKPEAKPEKATPAPIKVADASKPRSLEKHALVPPPVEVDAGAVAPLAEASPLPIDAGPPPAVAVVVPPEPPPRAPPPSLPPPSPPPEESEPSMIKRVGVGIGGVALLVLAVGALRRRQPS